MGNRRSRLATTFAAVYSVAFLTFLAFFTWLVAQDATRSLNDQIVESMIDTAELARLEVLRGVESQELADSIAAAVGARVSIIQSDGVVLADSEAVAAEMDNHADRPEVIEAIRGRIGVSDRGSVTLGDNRLYVAIPVEVGEPVVRISQSRDQVDERVDDIVRRIWLLAIPIGLLGLLGVALIGRRLARPIQDLTDDATELAGGRLDVVPERSRVSEIDRLGLAIAHTASQLGERIDEAGEERAALESALSALPQGVLLIEEDDTVSVSNNTARTLLGYTVKHLKELVPAALNHLVRQVRAGDEVSDLEIGVGRPERTLSVLVSPVDDRRTRVLLVLTDVTEQRRVDAMRRDFVADASHELKTPIAGIMASLETLRLAVGRDPEAVIRFSAQASASANRLAAIVGDLLDLSRLESSEQTTSRMSFGQVVIGEIEAVQKAVTAAGVAMEHNLSHVMVEGDKMGLALAVRNLIDNAIRYTGEGGSVRLDLTMDGDEAVLTVSDTGPGIPSRSLDRIFERFYRVDEARSRQTGGTGLGLSLVKHVVDRHGGSITVTSELGVGSTFTVRLPAVS